MLVNLKSNKTLNYYFIEQHGRYKHGIGVSNLVFMS